MRFASGALLLLALGCHDDGDWHGGDPELVVRNTGGHSVKVEVEDVQDAVFLVHPGERKVHGLSSYTFDPRITRSADNLALLDAHFDADDFDDDRVEITVTP